MGYNLTPAQREEEAKKDLVKKLILEKYLIRDLGPYYKKIMTAAKYLYATNGQVLDVSIFKPELKEILAKHYRRVSKQFGSLSQRQLTQILNSKNTTAIYDKSYEAYIKEHSQAQSNIINSTDQNKLNDAFKKALVLWYLLGARTPQATTSPTPVTVAPRSGIPQGTETHPITSQPLRPQAGEGINSENLHIVQSQDILTNVSKSGIEDFNSELSNRKEVIATTETQNSAETSKFIAIAAYLAQLGLQAKKQWITMMDDRVRPWHQEAQGQKVKDSEPFIVNGEQLRYPGDVSLGASPNNIINCRCSVHYFW